MKNNILKISSMVFAFVVILAIFNTTLTNKSHHSLDFLLSNIEALAQGESNTDLDKDKGSQVVDGSCKVKVNNNTYDGVWNKCDNNIDHSCRPVCVTAVM